jgi:hypothetical protein
MIRLYDWRHPGNSSTYPPGSLCTPTPRGKAGSRAPTGQEFFVPRGFLSVSCSLVLLGATFVQPKGSTETVPFIVFSNGCCPRTEGNGVEPDEAPRTLGFRRVMLL